MTGGPERRTSRRRQIEAAAIDCFALGYRATGVREIAEACGMTNAGVLHHFGSKDALLRVALDRALAGLEPAWRGVDAARDAPAARAALAAALRHHLAHPAETRLLVALTAETVVLRDAHPGHEQVDRARARLRGRLGRVVDTTADHLPAARRAPTAHALLLLWEGLLSEHVRSPRTPVAAMLAAALPADQTSPHDGRTRP